MEHQNWNTIYITKPNKNSTQKKPYIHNNEKKIENDIENGNMKTKKVSKNQSLSIQQKRLSKNLTQKELANKLNIPIKILNDIESGKGNKSPQILNKINNFLNK